MSIENKTPENEQLEQSKSEELKSKDLIDLDFSDSEKLFSQLKQSEGIDQEQFVKQFDELSPEQKDFVSNFVPFLAKHDILDSSHVLAFSQMSQSSISKQDMFIQLSQSKPQIIFNLLRNQIKEQEASQDKQEASQDKQEASQDKQEASQDKQEYNGNIDNGIENTDKISEAVRKIQKQIAEKAPELQPHIDQNIAQAQEQFPEASAEEVYLLAFDSVRKSYPEFSSKIKIDSDSQKAIDATLNKFGSLKISKIASSAAVSSEISNFVDSPSKFDAGIQDSLKTEDLDLSKLDVQEQIKLFKNHEDLVDSFLQSGNFEIRNFDQLKQNMEDPSGDPQKMQELENILATINNLIVSNYSQEYTRNYKQTAMEEYTKSVFKMLEQSIGIRNISEDFEQAGKNFDIENGNISMQFNYEGAPINLEVRDGNVYMSDLLGRENQDPESLNTDKLGTFQKQQVRVNHLFQFPDVNELLNPDSRSISSSDLLDKPDASTQVAEKLSSLNQLGNKTLMQAEIKTHLQTQKLLNNVLNTYRPPEQAQSILDGTGKVGNIDSGLYKTLSAIEKSLDQDPAALENLNYAFTNTELVNFLKNNANPQDPKSIGDMHNLFLKGRKFVNNDGSFNSEEIYVFSRNITNLVKNYKENPEAFERKSQKEDERSRN